MYSKLPNWPDKLRGRLTAGFEYLNLARVRNFLEKGRLDHRFTITQRHLLDSNCVNGIKKGVQLFNVNDYPFPYKIDIEVAGADQSSIDMIKRVGGSVTIVYMNRVNLRAHLKPFRFEVLPRTARPNLESIHYLEKMRARGCRVRYIKPMWLIDEEKRVESELQEYEAAEDIAKGQNP